MDWKGAQPLSLVLVATGAYSGSVLAGADRLSDSQRLEIKYLKKKGQRSGRLLANGDVEVRVSSSTGRFEYLITPAGTATCTSELPAMEWRRAPRGLILACALLFLVGGVSALLDLFGVIEMARWLIPFVAVAILTWVAVGLIWAYLADQSRSRDPFLLRKAGRRQLDQSFPVGRWVHLGSSFDDDGAY